MDQKNIEEYIKHNFKLYEINKSKFYSFKFDVQSKKEIEQILDTIKQLHPKATHICYGYKVIDNGINYSKAHDDKEPKGTAGYPILNLIEKKSMNNTIVIVVRYFGKSKLGAGLLLRSYLKAAAMVFDN